MTTNPLQKTPELITEAELRQYFLFINNVKHSSRNTSTLAICRIKFFFERRSIEIGPPLGAPDLRKL